jgi:hypothetical protein
MDPVNTPAEGDEPGHGDDIPAYLRDSQPERTQFGLKALFWFTTICSCYFAVERISGGRAAAVILGFGLPLVWLIFLALTIADRVMAWPSLILLAVVICGLVLFGAYLTFGF